MRPLKKIGQIVEGVVNCVVGPFNKIGSILAFPDWASRTIVEMDEAEIRCIWPDGQRASIAWPELQLVAIETNDGGPAVEDFYYYLGGPENGFYVPLSAQGAHDLTKKLLTLPGFNTAAYGEAIGSTSNAWFVCWERSRAS